MDAETFLEIIEANSTLRKGNFIYLQKQYNKLHEQFLESKEGAGKSKRKLSDCCFVHIVFGHKHMKTR